MVDEIFAHAFGAFDGVANGVARRESRDSWVNRIAHRASL
jgi:hypothetical protein